MWKALKKLLDGDEPDAKEAEDGPRLAASALLVEAALADGVYAEAEADLIRTIVIDSFAVTEADADALVKEAEGLAETAVDHFQFTKVAKTLPMEERERLVEGLWKVVFADGEECRFEDQFVRRVTALLGVDDRAGRIGRIRARDGG